MKNGGGMETYVLWPEGTDARTTTASREALHLLQDRADFIVKP